MTIRVSVTHHEPDSPHALLAEVFLVDPYGQVSDSPVRTYPVGPGMTASVHLHAGNVLVVREAAEAAAVVEVA